ncbi:DNA polymerase I [Oligella sp. MSHR50489EDL]|uniref:DNA polymerase I n=1 Tax=Oligella sp. MSHR50489EDL TaxID=3139409 RepID=UPI003D816140
MKKTLLLVDGSSYLYRAFFAMPNLRNALGEPTGAIYGVMNMMRKINQDYNPDYMACVFDAKGKTFRDDIYKEYKGNRPPMPDDLRSQIKPIHDAIRAMGWTVIAVEGVEADDVIATLTKKATDNGIESIISTSDKDMAQLVNEHVTLIDTMSNHVMDIEGVKERYGVKPEQIIDYLMLMGDTSDNIPGVPKVGPKTAAKWLEQYGTLDNIIAHADKFKGVVGQNLRDFIPNFEMTRRLVTIKDDCDLPEAIDTPEDLRPLDQDKGTLIDIFQKYGFRTWLRELSGDPEAIPEQDARVEIAVVPETPAEIDYQTVTTEQQLKDLIKQLEQAEIVALDTETDGLYSMSARLVGLSMSIKPGQAWYIPVAHQAGVLDEQPQQLDKAWVLEQLRPWLESKQAQKVLQNAKFDTHVLANEGLTLGGIAHDTMLMGYVLDSSKRVGMEDLMQRYLGRSGISYEQICGKGASAITFDQVAIDKAAEYACEDADVTLQLMQVMLPLIESEAGFKRIYELEMQVSPVLTTIERNGVKVDEKSLNEQSCAFAERLDELEKKAYEMVGDPFNLNSPRQLGVIFFEKMGLPVIKKTPKGAPSTDEETLNRLAEDYPLPKLILEYRSLAKLKSTYTDKLPTMIWPASGRVHTSYSQASVVTGRLSSSDPNLQNIPVRTEEGRRIRRAFIAEPGNVIMAADYSQIELRVMAHISGDEGLRKAFAEGKDIHRSTAAEIFSVENIDDVTAEQRRSAKAINFGLIYGMGVFGLANTLDISRDAAKLYIDRYFARYPGVADYMDRIKKEAVENGYVETVFGRRLWFSEIKGAKGPRRANAERQAINAPMQGTAADLIKMAMVAVQKFIDDKALKSRMIMQVHDELVLEVPEAEKDLMRQALPELMSNVAELSVPLIAEVAVGDNWRDAE